MNKFTRAASLMAVGCVLMTAPAYAGPPEDYFFLEGFVVSHEERIADKETAFGGRLGFGGVFARTASSRTGLEVGLFRNAINSSNSSGDDQGGVMVDLVQQYTFGRLQPYIFGGIGAVGESVGPAEGVFLGLELGGGLLFDLSRDLALRTGISAMSVRNDEHSSEQDSYVDFRLNVGLLFGMGSPAPAAAPVARLVDSDGDGLTDAKDACPSTPASTADGCPPAAPAAPVVQTDSDNDGVYDAQDECSGTLEGLKVDARGCAVETETQSIVLKGVTFLPSSANLTPAAKEVLAGAAAALTGQESLKVELGGHTDAQGKDEANLALSQRRADSVRAYLIGKGVAGDRLTAVGYGETQPIADNNTLEGRKENRRVELKIIK